MREPLFLWIDPSPAFRQIQSQGSLLLDRFLDLRSRKTAMRSLRKRHSFNFFHHIKSLIICKSARLSVKVDCF